MSELSQFGLEYKYLLKPWHVHTRTHTTLDRCINLNNRFSSSILLLRHPFNV